MKANKPHQFIHATKLKIENKKTTVILFVDNFSGYSFAPLITKQFSFQELTAHIITILKSIDMGSIPEFYIDFKEEWIDDLNDYFFEDAFFKFSVSATQKITSGPAANFMYSQSLWHTENL